MSYFCGCNCCSSLLCSARACPEASGTEGACVCQCCYLNSSVPLAHAHLTQFFVKIWKWRLVCWYGDFVFLLLSFPKKCDTIVVCSLSYMAVSLLETYCCVSVLSDPRQLLHKQRATPHIVKWWLHYMFLVLYHLTAHWHFKVHILHSSWTPHQALHCSNTMSIWWYSLSVLQYFLQTWKVL